MKMANTDSERAVVDEWKRNHSKRQNTEYLCMLIM